MSLEDSVYRPPQSNLELPIPARGSLEAAIAGNYELRIGEILGEAWALVKGSKGVIVGAMALVYAVAFGGSIIGALLQELGSNSAGIVLFSSVIQFATMFVTYPLIAGTSVYAIRRAAGDPGASFADVTAAFRRTLPIVGLNLLAGLLTIIGFLFLIAPGLYLAVAYFLAMPLLAERGLGVWEALETSRKSITHRWFLMLGLTLVTSLIIVTGALFTLGVGLIWLVPFGFLVYGVAYRNMFGVGTRVQSESPVPQSL